MIYIVEPWDAVDLLFTVSPYSAPDPLAVELDFVDVQYYGPIPWATPSITAELRAMLQTASAEGNETAIRAAGATLADRDARLDCGRAIVGDDSIQLLFAKSELSDMATGLSLGTAGISFGELRGGWNNTVVADTERTQAWDEAAAIDKRDYVSSWIMTSQFVDQSRSASWFSVNVSGIVYDDEAARLALQNTDTGLSVTLNFHGEPSKPENPIDMVFAFGYVVPARPIVPHDVTTSITARQATPRDDGKFIPWGLGDSIWRGWNLPYPVGPNLPPGPLPGEIPEIKLVYLSMNTLQIETIIDETPLDIKDVSISLDIDSLSWQFSGTVYGEASLNLVKPDEGGMKEISVTINGHEWLLMIERYSSDEQFPTKKFGISGISRTQYMAAPFAPTRSYTNSSATTAKQACENELASTGFTLAWALGGDADLPDWAIPAGALSYRDRSPAQVIGQIVKAAGGVMIPSRNSDSWTIKPRYSTPSWQWSGASPDVVIYVGMVRSRSAQFEPGPSFDACYVSGINQGEAVDVRRQGSGGLSPMPDIYDDLITDAQPAISRGKVELSAAGNKIIETLSVLIPENAAAPGIITPGQIAKIIHDDAGLDYFALVLSTRISVQRAGAAEIYQSVTLERAA